MRDLTACWVAVALLLAGCAGEGECKAGAVRCSADGGAVELCDCEAAEYFWLPLPWCKDAPRWRARDCPAPTSCRSEAVGFVCVGERLGECDDAHVFGACLAGDDYAECALPPERRGTEGAVHRGVLTRVHCPGGSRCQPDSFVKERGPARVCAGHDR